MAYSLYLILDHLAIFCTFNLLEEQGEVYKVIITILFFLIFNSNLYAESCPRTPSVLSYYFSPKGGVTDAIVQEISVAKVEVLVQMYVFTSLPIADALIAAKSRGVGVTVIVDDSAITSKGSKVNLLFSALIPVYIDKEHSIAHDKVMIVDKKTLITGSFNATASAETSNAENIVVVKRNNCIANGYIKNFELHKLHSVLYNKGILVGNVE